MNLSPLEYEGMEHILRRLLHSNRDHRDIRSLVRRTPAGICFRDGYALEPFVVKGIHEQQGTAILTACRMDPEGFPVEQEPIYIDMKNFMDTDEFDLELLVWKMYQHR